MHDEQQFEQLMLQYEQLKTGSDDIFHMIEAEDFDGAITMIKLREPIFLNCKCMRKYLELSEAPARKGRSSRSAPPSAPAWARPSA